MCIGVSTVKQTTQWALTKRSRSTNMGVGNLPDNFGTVSRIASTGVRTTLRTLRHPALTERL